MSYLREIEASIDSALRSDRARLRGRLRSIERLAEQGRAFDQSLERLLEEIAASSAARKARAERPLKLEFDLGLPVCQRREEIAAAIRERQVVVVCGETGSGKSTQLPKILLEMGYGVDGWIGHTQPRRIAARSVASRVAEELGSPLGTDVGFKVRFADQTRPETKVKLMTDGVLLAESQHDREFLGYDAIIVDEAHERSLNIDFLLGLLRRVQPRRPDLKIVITSATIDAQRFAQHFADEQGAAPVIEVSGRMYPVETLWRSPPPDPMTGEPDAIRGVCDALDEIGSYGGGDVLVFLPTERDIRECHKRLRGRLIGEGPVEILPLYARLSIAEQNKVFAPHKGRRVVLATNVAESSLTVPGIRFVVDSGTARVSRYSPKNKVQRLPIEPISRASADQRQGRCGRVGPGVCFRLYDQEDYDARERFAQPEILRSNLASVILQTLAFELGAVEHFPFLDPPRPDAIRDGYKTLFEIGAIDASRALTPIGRKLAAMPCDPRIGRIILQASEERCLRDVLVIAAALETQDPRERPVEREAAADVAHSRFFDPDSDFLGWLKLWEHLHDLKEKLGRSAFERACRENFLNLNRVREWQEVHRQFQEMVDPVALKNSEPRWRPGLAPAATLPQPIPAQATAAVTGGKIGFADLSYAREQQKRGKPTGPPRPNMPAVELPVHPQYGSIHRALLAGLLSNIALRGDGPEYKGAGGVPFFLWPGSNVFQSRPRWIVAAELVETNKRYVRMNANVDPSWIEALAPHLVHKEHHDPYWNSRGANVLAHEKATLFGLPLANHRRVAFGPIDGRAARRLFIEHALVQGDYEAPGLWREKNRRVIAEALALGAKLRTRDYVLDSSRQYDFFDARIPADVWDGHRFERWRREAERDRPGLLVMTLDDLLDPPENPPSEAEFPSELTTDTLRLRLAYRYDPGAEDDGVTLQTPVEGLGQLWPEQLGWLVPGMLTAKIEAIIRALPKSQRRNLVPAADVARKIAGELDFGKSAFLPTIAAALSRHAGEPIAVSDIDESKLPDAMRMNVQAIGRDGRIVAQGRDVLELKRRLGVKHEPGVLPAEKTTWNRDGVEAWDFGELPERIELSRGGLTVAAYPTLVDEGAAVSLRLMDNRDFALATTRGGLRRLFALVAKRQLRAHLAWLPDKKRLERLHAKLGHSKTLDDVACELFAERAFFPKPTFDANDVPRSKATFELAVQAAIRELPAAVAESTRLLTSILEKHDEVRTAIAALRGESLAPAIEDLKQQLTRMTPAGFWLDVPWAWLTHLPRYLTAMLLRSQKLTAGGAARDATNLKLVAPLYDRWHARRKQHQELRIVDPALETYRWMIEELRVSLFAQELGTSAPVSPQRLDKLWSTVRVG